MNKYLVFALERRIDSGHPVQGQLVQQCFELVKEFDLVEGTFVEPQAMAYAAQYSKDNRVRTVVLKGFVFEGVSRDS